MDTAAVHGDLDGLPAPLAASHLVLDGCVPKADVVPFSHRLQPSRGLGAVIPVELGRDGHGVGLCLVC